MRTVIIVNQAQMGVGDVELGRRILAACLRKLASFSGLEAIVLYNTGVTLATKGSFVAAELSELHQKGIDVLACGTCVEHFGIRDQMLFDPVSNMDEILACLRDAEKVVTL
jgi:intracellular sulfur oxidation DsrE/DsrF family protein